MDDIVIRPIPANAFVRGPADQVFTRWVCTLPPGMTLAEVMHPAAWQHHAGNPPNSRFNVHDIIRIIAADRSFDFNMTVVHTEPGGVVVEPWPKMPTAEHWAARPPARQAEIPAPVIKPVDATGGKINGKRVPRVDHTPALQYHVIGLDGAVLESAKHIKTEGAAQQALRAYKKRMRLEAAEAAADPAENETAA